MKGSKRFVRVNPTGAMILNGLLGDGAVEITSPTGPYYTSVDYEFTATTALDSPTYDWSLEPGMEIVSGQGTGTVTIRFTSPGVRSVRVAVTDGTGMTYRAAWLDHVGGDPPYTASVTPPGGTLYEDTNYTFTGSTDVPTPTYTWSVGAGATIVSGQGTASVVVSFSESGSRSVTLTVGGGGSASATWSGTVQPWVPSLVSGLALWLDASDASTITLDGSNNVELWADKSGNGRNFGQTDTLRRPAYSTAAVNGLNALSYDGVNDVLERAVSGQTWAYAYPLSVFIVFRATAFSGAYNTLWDFYGEANSTTAGCTGLIKSNGKSAIYATTAAGAANYDGTGALTYSTGTTNQFFARIADNAFSSRGNAVTDGSASGTWTMRTNIGTKPLELGASLKLTRYNQQRICEFLVYNAAISDSDRDKVEAYLKAKWGTP